MRTVTDYEKMGLEIQLEYINKWGTGNLTCPSLNLSEMITAALRRASDEAYEIVASDMEIRAAALMNVIASDNKSTANLLLKEAAVIRARKSK